MAETASDLTKIKERRKQQERTTSNRDSSQAFKLLQKILAYYNLENVII